MLFTLFHNTLRKLDSRFVVRISFGQVNVGLLTSVGTGYNFSSVSVNFLQLTDTSIPLSDSVKYVGVVLHITLSMRKFSSRNLQSCYFQLRLHQFCADRRRAYLSTDVVAKLHGLFSESVRLDNVTLLTFFLH